MKQLQHIHKQLVFFLCALIVYTAALSQEQDTSVIKEKFTRYQLQAVQEKIFTHTDKIFYLAGETIWFKLYTADESFNRPIGISKVAYVEVINGEQRSVMQAKISLQDGMGNGSFIISSALASGNYKLRAYTSRMKNFSADYYFEQPLTIVNTLKEPIYAGAVPVLQYRVDFFPEGGNLVNGINSTVAFKITDQYGNGINAAGYLLNGKSDTLARIETLQHGMGKFSLLPQQHAAYHAVFVIKDAVIVQNLPPAYDEGYTMHLAEDAAAGMLTVTVNTSSRFNNLPVCLFVHTRHVAKQVLMAKAVDGKAFFQLDKSKLGEGISHITVFNANRQPVCERLYFKMPLQKLLVKAAASQFSYTNRNKITVDLRTANQLTQPAAADMSVAVFMIDSLQPLQYQDIHAWMLLQSELAGSIESPQSYFTDSSATVTAALNNLLLTQGWRRFKWDDVLNNRMPAFTFITENEGPVINGTLVDKGNGAPQKNILATLTVPGENFELRSAVSREDGSLQFNVNDFYSSNEMIIAPVNAADSTVKINITSPFSDRFNAFPFAAFSVAGKFKDELLNRSINAQADNAYRAEVKKLSFATLPVDTNSFYGKPDKQYYLDDYTRFITMEEVMKEFITEVKVKKQEDGYQFRVVNGVFKDFFEQPPLVLIDGVPVSRVDKIMAFDPLKIKKIDVAAHKHYLGPLVSEGVVSYKTYQGDLGGYELDPNAIVVEYEGLQRQRVFYSPVYETKMQKESRLPDLRNVLYWCPDIKTGADGKQQFSFYTSDVNARFAIVVQGLTAEGLSGSGVTTFMVNK